MPAIHSSLDQNGFLPVCCVLGPQGAGRKLEVMVDGSAINKERLFGFLKRRLTLASPSKNIAFKDQGDATLVAKIGATKAGEYALFFNDKPLCRWHVNDKGRVQQTSREVEKLTVFETRMLGQYLHEQLPYSRHAAKALRAKHQFKTDLHTHLSSQISGAALIRAGVNADECYPAELLELAGIDTRQFVRHDMPSYEFYPTASFGLTCEQRGRMVPGIKMADLAKDPAASVAFERVLSIPADTIYTFDELERQVYRMRNPLTKNPALVRETILEVAKCYQQEGIAYAELSATGVLKPDWLLSAIDALEEAEKTYDVKLRLLPGIARSLKPDQMLLQLNQLKCVAQSPYIVGVDFLGYESNKTKTFYWALENIAAWAAAQRQGIDRADNDWTFADDFIIRVHAGENGKNPDNVEEVLQVAKQHQVRTRIGHAAYGDVQSSTKLAQKLAQKGLLIIEFNPDSNMALNNIDTIDQLPIKLWLDADIPSVISSDGAGAYQTDAKQLLVTASFAGLAVEDVKKILGSEKSHIAKQEALFKKKKAAFNKKYRSNEAFIHDYSQKLQTMQANDSFALLEHKVPVLIAGASGSSWKKINRQQQKEIEIAMAMLVQVLDPKRAYFALGRLKDAGVGKALDQAVAYYNQQAPSGGVFDVMGIISNHPNMPALAHSLNHIITFEGPLRNVPQQMINLLHEQHGHAIYIGGSAFTRDFINLSENYHLPFGVMDGPEGASSEKAQVLHKRYVFKGAKGLVKQLYLQKGGKTLFRPHVDPTDGSQLNALYGQAKALLNMLF